MKRAVIVCHRGACLEAPENTIASLEGAIAMNADVVELDVRTSRDGVLYVMHDATVDRTTDGNGRFADLTSGEIDELDAGSWFDPSFKGEKVPTLEAFLDSCSGRIRTYVEIKDADPGKVRDMLASRRLLEGAWTFSFDQGIRAAARAKVPDLRRMVLFAHVGTVARAVAQDAHILEFHESDLSADAVKEARNAGLTTQMFYNGDDRAVFAEAIRCGVDQMNIDHVEVFRSVEKDLLAAA